ncbi:alpha-D-ribose 1-methylphosphonate 5-triphosphate diphosphatase [Thermus sp.]|uniref:alpha-D-ribose 1-methylphosphonate 5-triphosphate diphosphatase n=1 Tax=Thermus sp. TaxID=275 RepID=UPI00298EE859|nr:alpha-D-ribose 1-methylphosphonate 5-triphosphate diphosphatase [Thermus sp.]MDW8358599.1 alpha-D-ribose 1-methylphosphonate 5-triphosphate diphosphatase [Thermus sp.]
MWLSGAKVVLPDRVLPVASLRLEGERVAEVREGRVAGGLPLEGLTLVPGVVDLHGDTLERELEPRPGVSLPLEVALEAWEARALGAGITTAYVAVSFWDGAAGVRAPEKSLEIVQGLWHLREGLTLDLRVHARYEVSRPQGEWAVEQALEEGLVHLLSLMDHTPGQGQFRNLEAYVAYMSRWLGRSPEEVAQELSPTQVAWGALEGLVQRAKARGVVLASHDDDTPERVALMAGLGVRISEFPLTLAAAQAARGHGMWVVMGAPNALRGGSHNGNLSALEALGHGLLHALATDYHPASALRAAFALAGQGLLPLEKAVALVSLHPAQAVGLADRGALLPGFRADLVVLREAPFAVLGVFVRGRPALLRGKMAEVLHG